MHATYNSWLVTLSVCVAVIVSFTALKLASRVAQAQRSVGRIWLLTGSTAMGIGVWSMHFIGMLAFSLPIPLKYNIATTLDSLAIAIVTSGFAIAIASRVHLSLRRLAISSVVMGAGIAAMHYTGMAAIEIVPTISYDPIRVALSISIAVTASFAALWLAFKLRWGDTWYTALARLVAAVVMGLAISGMHYTAMSASLFSAGSYCLGGVAFDNAWLSVTVGVVALGLLAVTLVTLVFDAHLESRTRAHTQRLEQANADLHHQATHDALTNLPNRVLFVARLERAISEIKQGKDTLAVMAVDLDRFKLINDSLGHGAGDKLLVQVAHRLTRIVGTIGTTARAGGDEFLLLVRTTAGRRGVADIAACIIKTVGDPYVIDSIELHTTPSIGISVYADDAATAETLIACADEAMYSAKQNGRNTSHFFASGMNVFTQERLQFENDLRRALGLQQFELHYQPQVEIASGQIIGVEALIRWHHPIRGLIPPDTFIPLAEETGLILPIGEWVLREASRQLRLWHGSGLAHLSVAVNLSATQFRQPNLVAMISAALESNGVQPKCLEIELTESAVMTDADRSIETLELLRRMGIQIAIDDFGTGYSNMNYLKRFPISKLKIDRSFVCDLSTSPDDESIVRAIVSLGHSLRLKVVAEGVETSDQLKRLKSFGCDHYQGYYCSRARPAAEIEALVRETDALWGTLRTRVRRLLTPVSG